MCDGQDKGNNFFKKNEYWIPKRCINKKNCKFKCSVESRLSQYAKAYNV